jgi:hypothetical protein
MTVEEISKEAMKVYKREKQRLTGLFTFRRLTVAWATVLLGHSAPVCVSLPCGDSWFEMSAETPRTFFVKRLV